MILSEDYTLSYDMFLAEKELRESVLENICILEESSYGILTEGMNDTITNYLNKVTQSMQQVYNKFLITVGTKKHQAYLNQAEPKIKTSKPSFAINNYPNYDLNTFLSYKVREYDRTTMSDDLKIQKTYMQRYYGSLYSERNNMNVMMRRNVVKGFINIKCDRPRLIQAYNFCNSGFYEARKSIEQDIQTINHSADSIIQGLKMVQTTQESKTIYESIIFEAINKPDDQNKGSKMHFVDSDGSKVDPTAKSAQNQNSYITQVANYMKISTQLVSAKMKILTQMYKSNLDIVQHYVDVTQYGDPVPNNQVQKVQIRKTATAESANLLLESDQKSNLDKNFKKKSSNINFKAIDIHSSEGKKYVEIDKYLSSVSELNKYKGEILLDTTNDKIIGRVLVCTGKDDGFIGALRVYSEYKGYGFGKILLQDAIKKYNGVDLCVYKDNKVAIKMYKDCGFVIVDIVDNGKTYYMKLKSKLNEDEKLKIINVAESILSIFSESKSSNKLYHVSKINLDSRVIKPYIPDNYFTKNGYEDNTTKRVCFGPSIGKCLRALSQNCTGLELYVHIPDGDYNAIKPTTNQVPDSKVTEELWITEPVKMKCIGKIVVTSDKGEDGLPFTYGDGKKAELYDWNWKWLEKY